MRVAGVMSGTSLDGIDVAIVDLSGRGSRVRVSVVAHATTPYPDAVRTALLGISNAVAHTGDVARLSFLLGELYVEAVQATCEAGGVPTGSVQLVGSHGQTIFHEGQARRYLGREVASTLQIGEASVLAERLGVPVVSDFRTGDMAAGGRGAPLVPFVDYLLFRHPRRGRVALNIGGIANLTAIPAGGRPDQVIAFDTGPGNMVSDALVAHYSGGARRYDEGGQLALRGTANERLLGALLDDVYYATAPPKSAGREQYGAEFLQRFLAAQLSESDAVATAALLTARTVALGIERHVQPRQRVDDLIVSGGGAHNAAIMDQLRRLLPKAAVATTSDFGVDLDAKEAIAFAILAYESVHGRPGNLPSATGASGPVVLGKITPQPGSQSGRPRSR